MDLCPWCGRWPIQIGFCRGHCGRKIYLHRSEYIDREGKVNISRWRCIDRGVGQQGISHETIKDSHRGREFICSKFCAAEQVLTHHEEAP